MKKMILMLGFAGIFALQAVEQDGKQGSDQGPRAIFLLNKTDDTLEFTSEHSHEKENAFPVPADVKETYDITMLLSTIEPDETVIYDAGTFYVGTKDGKTRTIHAKDMNTGKKFMIGFEYSIVKDHVENKRTQLANGYYKVVRPSFGFYQIQKASEGDIARIKKRGLFTRWSPFAI